MNDIENILVYEKQVKETQEVVAAVSQAQQSMLETLDDVVLVILEAATSESNS